MRCVTKAIRRCQELYKIRDFAKWAKKVGISDRALLDTVLEMDRGLLGDRLGAHVYKKRLGVDGRGKRGGGRAVLLYRSEDVALFLHGYLKNENDEISENEVSQLRLFAQQFLVLSRAERTILRAEGKLIALEG